MTTRQAAILILDVAASTPCSLSSAQWGLDLPDSAWWLALAALQRVCRDLADNPACYAEAAARLREGWKP